MPTPDNSAVSAPQTTATQTVATNNSNSGNNSQDNNEYTGIIVLIAMTLAVFFIYQKIYATLKEQKWSLKDALSENTLLPDKTDSTGNATILVSSSSRFIAFNGMLLISIIYMATGYYIIYSLFTGGIKSTESFKNTIETVENFLLYGASLFVPYVFNKLTSIAK